MQLTSVNQHDFRRFMDALRVDPALPEVSCDGAVIAAQADGHYYVDALMFRMALDEEPLPMRLEPGPSGTHARAAPRNA